MNTRTLNSFELDQICRDNLRRAGVRVPDFAEPTLLQSIDRLNASHRRFVRSVAAFCLAIGFLAGVSIPLILGAT